MPCSFLTTFYVRVRCNKFLLRRLKNLADRGQCDQISPDFDTLAKKLSLWQGSYTLIEHLAKFQTFFSRNFYVLGQIFIVTNGQILSKSFGQKCKNRISQLLRLISSFSVWQTASICYVNSSALSQETMSSTNFRAVQLCYADIKHSGWLLQVM